MVLAAGTGGANPHGQRSAHAGGTRGRRWICFADGRGQYGQPAGRALVGSDARVGHSTGPGSIADPVSTAAPNRERAAIVNRWLGRDAGSSANQRVAARADALRPPPSFRGTLRRPSVEPRLPAFNP